MIRFVRSQDAGALLAIYAPYVTDTAVSFETAVPTLAEFRARIASISADFPYLVAEEDGEILGYAYAHPFASRAAYAWTAETTVYLRQDARGRGLGRRLYSELLRLLRLQGYHTAVAIVTVPNLPSAAFHRALGFASTGTVPNAGFKQNAWHAVEYFTLSLAPADPPRSHPVSLSALPPESKSLPES